MSWNSIHRQLQGDFNNFGLFDRPGITLVQAVHRHAERLAELAGITQDDSVLDVGAAAGKTVEYLRSITGCEAVGIDIEPYGDVLHGDMCDVPFPDNSFTVYWSVCALDIAPDRDKALSEARRVLKPGGRLVVSDWCIGDGDFLGWEIRHREDWTASVIETYRRMRRKPVSREDYSLLRWAYDDAVRGIRKHYAVVAWSP